MKLKDIVELFNAHGIVLDFTTSPETRPFWSGSSVAASWGKGRPSRAYLTDMLHELAHWLLCPKKYRRMINFGLGPSPADGETVRSQWRNSTEVREKNSRPQCLRFGDDEETLASLLGIIYEAHLGGAFTKTLKTHSWDDPTTDPHVREVVTTLRRKKLLGNMRHATNLVVTKALELAAHNRHVERENHDGD